MALTSRWLLVRDKQETDKATSPKTELERERGLPPAAVSAVASTGPG